MSIVRSIPSLLASPAWWKTALTRALYTAIAIAVPYVAGASVAAVAWDTVFLASAMGAIASLATSLAGLPEAQGQHVPLWVSGLERAVKTFCQALAAGWVGAVLLTDVAWSIVLQAALLSTVATVLRWVMSILGSGEAAVQTLEAVPVYGEVIYSSGPAVEPDIHAENPPRAPGIMG